MCEIACCCQQSGIYVPYPLSLAKKIDETADGVNWTIDTMPSVASSSSFSTGLLLHSPTTTLLGRRRRRKNFVRMVTRSCLDDSSALLRAAQYTVWTFNSWLPLFPTLKFCSFSCILFFFPSVIIIRFFMPIQQLQGFFWWDFLQYLSKSCLCNVSNTPFCYSKWNVRQKVYSSYYDYVKSFFLCLLANSVCVCVCVSKLCFGYVSNTPFWWLVIVHFIWRWMNFVDMCCCLAGGYIREKWHGCRIGVWSCFWYGHSAFGSPAS